ncbi:helix-turn-helix transcriptional regulator [Acidovorax sp. K2F]|uniref:helix-turn-helix transcriptional regulator n=1 Tax=Acidovorax sp. K2F TaxID=2978125 RepID=UPI003919364F
MKQEQKRLLGMRLKLARVAVRQSQGHVAEVLGVTRQSVSAWETGASCPSATQLAELSALYCTCAHSLLFGESFRPLSISALVPRGVRV